MKTIQKAGIVAFMLSMALGLQAQDNPKVGGAPMSTQKNIVENAVNSPIHTTLVAPVKAADLVSTLQGEGPFTVFAPVNGAFEALPKGTVSTLLKPENKRQLQAVLTHHVIPGKLDASQLLKAIKKGDGQATYTTVQGAKLTFTKKGKNLMVSDQKGNTAQVTIANVFQSNGVIHVIDTVLLP